MSRNALAIVSSLLFAALAALLVLLPVPYVAWRPGQTIDVLGATDKGPVIDVTGLPTYETNGRLLMTTVSTTSVDATLSLPEAIFVYLDPTSDAMPREVIYPPGKSSGQVESEAVAMMDSSRNNATVAALRAGGVKVTELPLVQSVVLSGPSADKLQPGDLITAVDGQPVTKIEEIGAQISTHAVGDPVVFSVLRDGKQLRVSVSTVSSNTRSSQPVVGINLEVGFRFDPIVAFNIDAGVTGPSAGLIFALGLYDRITEGALTQDRVVAGTGTINPTGVVGRIGAIREKIRGAERDGAQVFLAPEGNCADIGEIDADLTIVKVSTLKDAISALQLINEGNLAEVPTCG
ncbi:MAG: PDZ domain-containing protein [Tessaracoccus sp.]|uniref:YlbL family protein n=1 Tax=Tessaracoccus sp. TaxID=1971211 RepID=UPI001ED2EEF4|nr:PDZ domain-containing protein [Tessaracoccus sp.]MBK7821350.1 PDZ domain-containing protein [Tessaracoccus sp.]